MRGLSRFFSNWRNILPLIIVGLFVCVAVAAPLISPPADPGNPLPFKLVDSIQIDPLPPGPGIPLGTTVFYEGPAMLLHYDVLHSLVWGTRDALRFGLMVALISASLGIVIGAVSGYVGGIINVLAMRVTDAFLAFPLIAAVWVFQEIMRSLEYTAGYYDLDAVLVSITTRQRLFTALGLDPITLAFIAFSWMPFARIINANILRLKHTEYVLAAQTVGAKPKRIIFRHLLPNAIAPAIVLIARDIGGLVVLQAAFIFIGIGGSVIEGLPEWSRLLLLGRNWIIGIGGNVLLFWWLYLPATLALVLFGVGWNILGDRLNAVLNPWDSR